MTEQLTAGQELEVLEADFDSKTLALKGMSDAVERRRMHISIDYLLDRAIKLDPAIVERGSAV